MNRIIQIVLILLLSRASYSQHHLAEIDSLLNASAHLLYSKPDSALALANNAKALSQADRDSARLAKSYFAIMTVEYFNGKYSNAFTNLLLAKEIANKINNQELIAKTHATIGYFHQSAGNARSALKELKKSATMYAAINDAYRAAGLFNKLAELSVDINQPDSAKLYLSEAERLSVLAPPSDRPELALNSTIYYLKVGDLVTSKTRLASIDPRYLGEEAQATYAWMSAEIEFNEKRFDHAIMHSQRAIELYRRIKAYRQMYLNGYAIQANILFALKRYKEALRWKDEMLSGLTSTETKEIENIIQLYEAEKKRDELAIKDNAIKILRQQNEIQKLQIAERTLILTLGSWLGMMIVIASVLAALKFRSSQKKQLLEKVFALSQKEEEMKQKQMMLLDSQKQIAELKLTAMRTQLNPQFIFNALGSIQACIHSNNNDTAMKYLSRFSKLLRMILESGDKRLIPLESEIKILNWHLEIELLRCNNEVKYSLQMSRGLYDDVFVPPMLLQPFIDENIKARRHGEEMKIDVMIEKIGDALQYTVAITGELELRTFQKRRFQACQVIDERLRSISPGKDINCELTDVTISNNISFGSKLVVTFPIPDKHSALHMTGMHLSPN